MSERAAAPLALEYHSGLQSWRKGSDLIDALPYVDTVPSDSVRAHIEQLIEQEKRRSTKTPADYLRELPPVPKPRFENHPALQAEYERVRNKQPMPALDTTRYQLNPPTQAKRNDFMSWKQALDNANSQLEHQHLRIVNQELLLKHGDKVWRAQAMYSESLVKQAEEELRRAKQEVENVNKERKLKQDAAGVELRRLHQQYLAQALKNVYIEHACDKLEDTVSQLESQLQALIRADTEAAGASAPVPAAAEDAVPDAPQGNGHAVQPPLHADAQGTQELPQHAQPGANGHSDLSHANTDVDLQGSGDGADAPAAGALEQQQQQTTVGSGPGEGGLADRVRPGSGDVDMSDVSGLAQASGAEAGDQIVLPGNQGDATAGSVEAAAAGVQAQTGADAEPPVAAAATGGSSQDQQPMET